MNNKQPEGLEQLDFKLLLAFTTAYENLYEKGEINEEQFEELLSLIENYRDYTLEDFKKNLESIFNNAS